MSQQMGLASMPIRDLAAKKVNPADTFARVLENFIVIHCYVLFANWSFFEIFLILVFFIIQR